MKKYFIVLAAALVALASCTKKEETYTSISLKPAEITLGLNEQQRLTLLYEPASLAVPAVTWASSNEKVAVVDQEGRVIGKGDGEANITATFSDKESKLELKGACKVTVKSNPFDVIEWGGWCLIDLDKEHILNTKDTVLRTLQSGQVVKCLQIPAEYYVWDSDVTINDEGYFTGAGYVIEAEGTALLITDDLGKGPNYYYLGVSKLDFVDPDEYNPKDTTYANCCSAGKITGTAEEHMAWLDDETGDVPAAFEGARIAAIDFDNGKYLGYMEGLAGVGRFVGDEIEAFYSCTQQWFDGLHAYGLVVEEIGEEQYDFKQPYEWAPLITSIYEKLPEEEAVYTAKEFVAPKQDLRKFARPTNVLIKK